MATCSNKDRNVCFGTDDGFQTAHQFFVGQFTTIQVLFQQGVFTFSSGFDQLCAGFLSSRLKICGDLFGSLALPGVSFHREQVDHAFESCPFPPRQLDRDQADG